MATDRRARIESDSAHRGQAGADDPPCDADHAANDNRDATQSDSTEANEPPEGTGASTTKGEGEGEAAPVVPEKKKTKGHGRNGASAYVKAKHIFHALAAGIIGMCCEVCGIGRLTQYREKTIIRVIGQPLFGAENHHYEQARCKNCGHIVRATGPTDVLEGIGKSYVIYDWSACGMLIVMHYFGGAPFKRLESLHQSWGIPMADSNQWNMVDACDDHLLSLYKAIERYTIGNATNFRIDDTNSMIITLQREIQAEIAALELVGESTKDVRTGINATGTYWETPNGPVILFYTGRHHAGEIVDQLFSRRESSAPRLVKVTDGASKNFDHEQGEKLLEAACNAHAFLKFHDIKNTYPTEYVIAGRVYKAVFDHDDKAKAMGLNPVDRILYHRKHSKPLMEELKAMCAEKLESKLVEPSSTLWEPLSFVINQWERLTRFYEVPGVPLDSNLVEQTLVVISRYLAGSFNYKTVDGAQVGDHHMSLIATARANGVEPVAYLTECLRNREDLAKRPEHYLPWVYRERMKEQVAQRPVRENSS